MNTDTNINAKTKTTPYDTAEYLKTDEDMRLYLEACFEEDEGDGALIRAALNDIARARGMGQIAKAAGMASENFYKALSTEGSPALASRLRVKHYAISAASSVSAGV